jgi:hypothetical protein
VFQGVTPWAQLLSVPRVRVPSGAYLVTRWAEPAAGPEIVISVRPVMRRFIGSARIVHWPSAPRWTRATVHAVGVHLFQDFVVVAHAVGIEDDRVAVKRLTRPISRHGEARLDIFVVHHQKAIGRGAVDREEMHPVMVHADLHALFGAAVAARNEGGHVACQRRAPGARIWTL